MHVAASIWPLLAQSNPISTEAKQHLRGNNPEGYCLTLPALFGQFYFLHDKHSTFICAFVLRFSGA